MPANKVAVIMVTHNRSDVTTLALDALVRAQNHQATFKLFLVDNASDPREYARIARLFEYLQSHHGLDGITLPQSENLGFSAGNNVGINQALSDPSITHICLLNNDVITPPRWLDILVAHADGALVSPLSNSVGNEQIIPVPYTSKGINGYTRQAVFDFAAEHERTHVGNVVPSRMLGFFCVLGPVELFRRVGPLDEGFGLGYFEDDDYCLRTEKAGFAQRIVRQGFVHHWGSASFAALPGSTTHQLFVRNRARFESKHGVTWRNPSDGAWDRSLAHELTWLGQGKASAATVAATLMRYQAQQPGGRVGAILNFRQQLAFESERLRGFLAPRLPAWVPPLYRALRTLDKGALQASLAPLQAKLWPFPQAASPEVKPPTAPPDALPGERTGPTVFVLPIQGYFGRRQRPQHIADGLAAAGTTVYWLAPERGRHSVQRLPSGVFHAQLDCDVDYSNFYTTGLVPAEAAALLADLQALLPPSQTLADCVLLVQAPFWAAAASAFPGRVVYDCMDLQAGFGSATMDVELLESQLLSAADQLVVTSDHLQQTVAQHLHVPPDTLPVIRNACAPADFLRHPRRFDAAAPPVVGYFGAVAEWFDHQLLLDVAARLPHVRFEIIGDHFFSPLGKLPLPPNLTLLGEKPYAQLPDLVTHWRAALIPFRITDLIRATNPVKLYEYSALGLPVVSTPIPEVMRADIEVYIGGDAETFATQLQFALDRDSQAHIDARRDFAQRNSWQARVQQLIPLLSTPPPPAPQLTPPMRPPSDGPTPLKRTA